MDNRTVKIKSSVKRRRAPLRDSSRENIYITLMNDGCEDFFNYINWLNLAKSSNTIVLPSTNYYYIPVDLQDTEILINLKPLNFIKDLKAFLINIRSLLPEYSYLTGYFEDYCTDMNKTDSYSKNMEENNSRTCNGNIKKNNGHNESRAVRKLRSLFNPGINYLHTNKSARSLLEGIGFTVLNITGLNGKTYFCAQKRPSVNR